MQTDSFKKHILGVDTEFQDNNFATSKKLHIEGAGLFRYVEEGAEHAAFGIVTALNKTTMMSIELCDFVFKDGVQWDTTLFNACRKNHANCLLVSPTGHNISLERSSITSFEVLDMAASQWINGVSYRLLKRNKFGTVWFLKNTKLSSLRGYINHFKSRGLC